MSVVRLINRSILCGLFVLVLVVLGNASSAFALAPWWHVTSGSRPASVQPGSAKDEVQEITVSATGGFVFLIEPIALQKGEFVNSKGEEEFTSFGVEAQASVVQEGL